MALQGLRLTWQLGSPVVMGAHPIHVDSLLAYAQVQETLEDMGLRRDAGEEYAQASDALIRELAERPLPLARDERDGLWVWKASAIRPAEGACAHALRHWTRRTDPYDHANRIEAGQLDGRFSLPLKPYSQKLDTQRGAFKQIFKFYPVKDVEFVHAWVVGDRDRIEELLSHHRFVTNLGSKARMGHGRVIDFKIVSDPSAETRWQERVLPWDHDGAEQLQLATHPPYWAPENVGLAWARPDLFA